MRLADMSLEQIAKCLDGTIVGRGPNRQVRAPAPGHRKRSDDARSFTLKIVPGAPEDFVTNSFVGDDEIMLSVCPKSS